MTRSLSFTVSPSVLIVINLLEKPTWQTGPIHPYRTLLKAGHCKKSLSIFPSPTRMSLTKLSLAGKNLIIPGQGEFGQWHPPGDGKIDKFFYSVRRRRGYSEGPKRGQNNLCGFSFCCCQPLRRASTLIINSKKDRSTIDVLRLFGLPSVDSLVSRKYLTSGWFSWCKLCLFVHSSIFSTCCNPGLASLSCTVKNKVSAAHLPSTHTVLDCIKNTGSEYLISCLGPFKCISFFLFCPFPPWSVATYIYARIVVQYSTATTYI